MQKMMRPALVLSIVTALYGLSGCDSQPDEGAEAPVLELGHATLELAPTAYPDAIRIDAASMSQRCIEAIQRCQKKCDDACAESGRGCSSITTSSTLGGCACLEWRCTNGPKTNLLEPAVFQTP